VHGLGLEVVSKKNTSFVIKYWLPVLKKKYEISYLFSYRIVIISDIMDME